MPSFVEDSLKWLRRHLAKPLSRAVSESVTLLGLTATIIKTFEGYSWREVFLSSYFLTVAFLALVYMLRDVYRYRASIAKKQQVQAYVVLAALIGVCGFMAWKAWSYVYNPVGIYENRHWQVSRPDRKGWRWNVRGATDTPLTVTIRFDVVCSGNGIDKLYPRPVTPLSPNSHETGFQKPEYREWQVDGLQRPAELQFVLVLKNPIQNPDKCITHQIRLGGS